MTKDVWIQRAKALLFDLAHAVDSRPLKDEIHGLIYEAGDYDPEVETCNTELRWPGADP